MKYKIDKPVCFSETGKRKNNEDSLYPLPGEATSKTNHFVVCDGVGGRDKGEIASELAAKSFYKGMKLAVQGKTGAPEDEDIMQAFNYMQAEFDKIIEQKPEVKGMATTLVSAYLHEEGITVTHCGDSPLLHARKGAVIWQTEDHTMVNELLKHGVLTEEEAKESKKNQLSRAIQGNSVKKTKPDIHIITDIKPGDYFILCSDGVSGSMEAEKLATILTGKGTDEEKAEKLKAISKENTKDNYTAYFFSVSEKEALLSKEANKTAEESNTKESVPPQTIKSASTSTKKLNTRFALAALAVIIIVGLLYWSPWEEKKSPDEKNKQENTNTNETSNTENKTEPVKTVQAEIKPSDNEEEVWRKANLNRGHNLKPFIIYLQRFPEGKYSEKCKNILKNRFGKNPDDFIETDVQETDSASENESSPEQQDTENNLEEDITSPEEATDSVVKPEGKEENEKPETEKKK